MKNDSWSYPFETSMDDMFDHNKDGKLTGLETMQRDAMLYDSYKQTTNDSEASSYNNVSSGYTPKNNNNSSLQNGYNILFVLAIGFIAVVSPILTIAGLIKDAEYFFEQSEFIFTFIVSIIDLIVLLVYICKKINRSCEPDLSQCTTNEERGLLLEKSEKEKQKKFTKLILVIICICVAIGLAAFLKVDISYRKAVDEVINSDKKVWSFDFDTEKHPNYKDAKGWELYVDSKVYSNDSYKEEFLKYEFKHTNAKQDKAILELKNKIREYENKDNTNTEQEQHDLVGTWYCHSYRSCNGGSITITITQKGNTLYFNRLMIMSTASASSNIDYEVELPINDSFRVDDLHCTYVFDDSTLKEKFDDDKENVFERESDDDSSSYTTTTKRYYTTTKHYTTRYYTTKHTTTKEYDPYNAKDYSNEEDFYYDNYYDFESYEDAEDYYNDYN